MTLGLLVLVQEVMAAISTEPWVMVSLMPPLESTLTSQSGYAGSSFGSVTTPTSEPKARPIPVTSSGIASSEGGRPAGVRVSISGCLL